MNEQTFVYWIRQPNGSFKYDYRVFDRYMSLVSKYLNPEVYCLYCADLNGSEDCAEFSLLDPASGKGMNDKLELFRQAIPDCMNLVQISHYGGAVPAIGNIPLGYVMSVRGNKTRVKAAMFGARNLPMLVAQHYRASKLMDVRPPAPRGIMRACMEYTMRQTLGMGPLGMDLWSFPADATRGRRYPGTLERQGASNLSMGVMGASALLAPGPYGSAKPLPDDAPRVSRREIKSRTSLSTSRAGAVRTGCSTSQAKRAALLPVNGRDCERKQED